MALVIGQVAVGVGHGPHQLHHSHLLYVGEALVQARGETEQVGGLLRGGGGQLDEALSLVR